MNRQQAITDQSPATRSTFNYKEEWDDLEDFAVTARGRMNAVSLLIGRITDHAKPNDPTFMVTRFEMDTVLFMFEEVRDVVHEIYDRLGARPPLASSPEVR